MKVLHDDLGHANIILLLVDGATPRFKKGLYDMLIQMTAVFGEGWWDFMMVGVSKWHFDPSSINRRTTDCEEYGEDSNYCKNEAWFKDEIRLQLYDKFVLTHDVPIIFIDSFSQSGSKNINDIFQQKMWKNATDQGSIFVQSKSYHTYGTI